MLRASHNKMPLIWRWTRFDTSQLSLSLCLTHTLSHIPYTHTQTNTYDHKQTHSLSHTHSHADHRKSMMTNQCWWCFALVTSVRWNRRNGSTPLSDTTNAFVDAFKGEKYTEMLYNRHVKLLAHFKVFCEEYVSSNTSNFHEYWLKTRKRPSLLLTAPNSRINAAHHFYYLIKIPMGRVFYMLRVCTRHLHIICFQHCITKSLPWLTNKQTTQGKLFKMQRNAYNGVCILGFKVLLSFMLCCHRILHYLLGFMAYPWSIINI